MLNRRGVEVAEGAERDGYRSPRRMGGKPGSTRNDQSQTHDATAGRLNIPLGTLFGQIWHHNGKGMLCCAAY